MHPVFRDVRVRVDLRQRHVGDGPLRCERRWVRNTTRSPVELRDAKCKQGRQRPGEPRKALHGREPGYRNEAHAATKSRVTIRSSCRRHAVSGVMARASLTPMTSSAASAAGTPRRCRSASRRAAVQPAPPRAVQWIRVRRRRATPKARRGARAASTSSQPAPSALASPRTSSRSEGAESSPTSTSLAPTGRGVDAAPRRRRARCIAATGKKPRAAPRLSMRWESLSDTGPSGFDRKVKYAEASGAGHGRGSRAIVFIFCLHKNNPFHLLSTATRSPPIAAGEAGRPIQEGRPP